MTDLSHDAIRAVDKLCGTLSHTIASCTTARRKRGAANACAYAVQAPPKVERVARVTCPSCGGSRMWMAPQPGGNDRSPEPCCYCDGRGTIRETPTAVGCRQCAKTDCEGCIVYVYYARRKAQRIARCEGEKL